VIAAKCHCGAVVVEVSRRPRSLTDCNCSICWRYGVRWAYYKESEVKVKAKPGATEKYNHGERSLNFVRCKSCGCVMYWRSRKRGASKHMGVNSRNFDVARMHGIPIRLLDGADTWKYLD
jgi:hypothetical protein